jgi:3D (Asp-Asp-Asp) domain-containing protein
LLHRDRGVSRRANARIIPAHRGVLSLPLVAIVLIAGPANAVPMHSARQATGPAKNTSAAPVTPSAPVGQASSTSHKNVSANGKTGSAPELTHSSHLVLTSPTDALAGIKLGQPTAHDQSGPPKSAPPKSESAPPKSGSHLVGEARTRAAAPPPAHHVPRPTPPKPPARTPLGTFMVTCYDLTGHTATGDLAGPESVAVDPSVIPLGTKIYVPGIGERSADDTGGLIIGDHIDIWEPTYSRCADWGARYVPIYRVG